VKKHRTLPPPAQAASGLPVRYDPIDALRGLAMVWMTLFHFSFDLNEFGYIHQNFYADPFWTVQRACIVSLFVFTAGLGQAVALHQGQGWARFGRRWAQVAVCALLVTAGSWWMYPRSFIYFGVLHGLALMLVVARLSARCGRWLWPLGVLAVALPQAAPWLHAHQVLGGWTPLLNTPALNWLGLISHKPVTEDYVPLLPWLGTLWFGLAAGGVWMRQKAPLAGSNGNVCVTNVATKTPPKRLLTASNGTSVGGLGGVVVSLLARLGRWSLPYYMLHQLVLMGALMGLAALR